MMLEKKLETCCPLFRVLEGRGVESKTYLPKGFPGRDYHGVRFRGADGLLHVCDGPIAPHPRCFCLVHDAVEAERETKEKWR